MPKPDLREATSAHEPLLPIEKKLIGWSLGTGLALLALLACRQSFRAARLERPLSAFNLRDVRSAVSRRCRRLMLMTDWNPTLYSKFEAERMRAARDLLGAHSARFRAPRL